MEGALTRFNFMKSSNSILSVSLLINLLLISSLIFLVLFQKSPNFVSESPREPEVTTNDLDERVVLDERVEAPKTDVSSEGQTLNASEAASPDFSSLLEELEELDLRIVPARL